MAHDKGYVFSLDVEKVTIDEFFLSFIVSREEGQLTSQPSTFKSTLLSDLKERVKLAPFVSTVFKFLEEIDTVRLPLSGNVISKTFGNRIVELKRFDGSNVTCLTASSDFLLLFFPNYTLHHPGKIRKQEYHRLHHGSQHH